MADEADRDEEPAPTAQWPYAAAPSAELETIRRDHIKAETNIKGLGTLLLIGGVLQVVGVGLGLYFIASMFADPVSQELRDQLLSPLALAANALPFVYAYAGLKLRRLEVSGQRLFTLAFVASFFVQTLEATANIYQHDLPAGTAFVGLFVGLGIGAFFLSIVWTPRARTVFSEHYQQVVIPATPHVKYASRLLWVLALSLGVLLGLLGAVAFVSP